MSFEPKIDWKDGDKVPAADFNRIEQGIADAQTVAWADVTSKPATYPPTIGTTATTAKAGNYAPAWGDVTGKPTTFAPIIGNTATTAKAGNYAPTWAEVTGKPAVIAAGADAAAARTAIGAGTSNLTIGTTATTAKAGNWTPTIGDIPTGTTATTVALGNHTHAGLVTPTAAPAITIADPADAAALQAAFDSLVAALKTAKVLT